MLVAILYSNPLHLCTWETRDIMLDCESIVFYTVGKECRDLEGLAAGEGSVFL